VLAYAPRQPAFTRGACCYGPPNVPVCYGPPNVPVCYGPPNAPVHRIGMMARSIGLPSLALRS